MLLRQQRSSTVWVHEAHVSHATAERPVKIAWKCAAHSHTTCFSSLWLLSIFLRCKRRQWALCGLAFPVSWSNHDSCWRSATYQTQSASSTHCINAHIGSPCIREKHACVGDSQKRGHSFWEFVHTQRQMTAEILVSMLLPQNLLGRKGTFASSVLCALGGGELLTLTPSFRPWLLLGNKWSSKLSERSSCCFLLSFAGEESWRHHYDFWLEARQLQQPMPVESWLTETSRLSGGEKSWVKSVTTAGLKLEFCFGFWGLTVV